MKHYKVRIVETLVMDVDVEAESAGEAEQIVSDRWRDSEYLLDADNFAGVEFMDSSGIAIVIACVRRMRQLRGEVVLRSVPPQPLKVLKASGIERIAKLEEERSLVHET